MKQDICEECKHSHYEKDTDSWFCDLNLQPVPHPDEPENDYCPNRNIGVDEE